MLSSFVALLMVAAVTQAIPIAAQGQEAPGGAPSAPPEESEQPERVELVGLRTANAKVYQEPDGSKTAVIRTDAIHYRAPDGSWKEIDNRLEPSARGAGYVNRAGGNAFEFAPRAQGSGMVTIGQGNAHLSFGIEGGLPRDAVVDGNEITYPDVLPGTDLRMSLHGESLKEMLVLKTPPALLQGEDLRVVFPLRTSGLTPAERDGGIVLENPHGEVVFRIPKPFMFDSNVDAASGDSAFSEEIRFELEEDSSGPASLVLVADGAWLLDPARVYPVHLDPTVFGPNSPSVDTFVQSNIFNTPQDQADELKSGYYEGPQSPEPITTRSLLRFNLESITHGSTINSATLSVWNKHSYICAPRPVGVHRITTNWSSSVTWTNRPSFEQTPADTESVGHGVECSGGSQYVNFDVRSIVSFWKNTTATNEGFLLKAENELNVEQWKKWASDEGGNKPQLQVNYEDSNRAPFVPILQSPVPDATVRNVSPTFSAWYEDPDGNAGQDEFQVFRASDSLCPDLSCAFRWGSGTQVQSRSWSSFTADRDLPAGQYKWRARAFDGARRSEWSNVSNFWIDAPDPPTITGHPPDYTTNPSATYSFSGNQGATFQCVLEYVLPSGQKGQHSSTSPCPSPKSYQLVDDAVYTFKVATINPSDGTNRSPYATHSFTLDRAVPGPPTVQLKPPQTSPGNARSIEWEFFGETGAEFRCRFTGPQGTISGPEVCTSPQRLDLLPTAPDGTYTLDAWQKDRAGNLSTTPGTASYVLDTTAPDRPIITGGPPDRTRNTVVVWSFSGESGATFQCRLSRDGAEVYTKRTCKSGDQWTLTQDGTYTFEVWQRDPAGNESAQPRTDTVVLDRITGKPSLVRSTTHVPYVAMKATRIEMTWNAAEDDSGIDGYYWTFLTQAPNDNKCTPGEPGTTKNEEHQLTAQSASSLEAGRYWFEICAADNLGNLGEPVSAGPFVVDPNGSSIFLSPTLPSDLVAQSDTNGLEQFYPFRAFDLGHYTGYANLDTGNLVVQATDFEIPGKGLNTVIRHTYNSARTDPGYHDTGLGRGWTLSLADADAGLDFAGSATDIDLNTPVVPTFGQLAGMAAGVTGGILELTDGDGTVHRFTRPGGLGTRWEAPPGVDLRVRENVVSGTVQSYDLVRPDGVVYRVERVAAPPMPVTDTWHVSQIIDRNGNKLLLEYGDKGSPTDTKGPSILPKIRVEKITRTVSGEGTVDTVATFAYTAGRLTSMEAVPGEPATDVRRIQFAYDESGYLEKVTEDPAGEERISWFDYTTYERDLTNPLDDVRLLWYVEDGEGRRTHFEFDELVSPTGANRLEEVCDRLDYSSGQACDTPTTIDYAGRDPNTGVQDTTVTVPVRIDPSTEELHDSVATYRISGRGPVSGDDRRIAGGNVIRISDEGSPTPVVRQFDWHQNLLVKKTNGAGAETLMHYNSLGLLTKVDSPPVNAPGSELPANAPTGRVETTFVYDGVEGSDYPADKCSAPSSGGHPQISAELWCDTVAELVRTRTGGAGHGDARITDFDYDAGEGNLEKVYLRKASSVPLPADPDTGFAPQAGDRVVSFEHHTWGGTKAVRGPRDVADDVTYPVYDETGFPSTITDAAGHSKTFDYSPFGELLSATDRDGRTFEMKYDRRGNLIETYDPDDDKTVYTYDKNDNQTSVIAPRGFDAGNTQDQFKTITIYNQNEWPEKVIAPGATEAQPSLLIDYNLDGTRASKRNEAGARTFYEYYDNGNVKEVRRPAGTGEEAVTTITYDAAGRRSHVRLPYNGNARPERRWTYAPAGTVVEISETSAVHQDRVASFAYDAFGARVEVLGPRTSEEQLSTYDPWGELTKLTRRATADKILRYEYTYDDAGNVKTSVQPTGDDQSLTTEFVYDTLNRLIEQSDPQNPEHTVRYTYTNEGLQKTRSDFKGDSNLQRRIVHEYNPDGSVRSVTAEDHTVTGGPVETLALCNFTGSDHEGGYDSNGNLLKSRTVKGSNPSDPCGEPDVLRLEEFRYDRRDRLDRLTQTIQLPGMGAVSRTQELAYDPDDVLSTSTWGGDRVTEYGHSPGGVLEEVTDWRADAVTVGLGSFPAGNPEFVTIPNAASATMTYHPDGSTKSLEWERATTETLIRGHSDITYDVGGLRRSENVSITHAAGATTTDTGGVAKFDYDLAGRLTAWTSPFRLSETISGTDSPLTVYDLDDGGNIEVETVTGNDGAGTKWIERTSTYENSRLETKTIERFGLAAPLVDDTTTIDPTYNAIGEEKSRSTSTVVDVTPVPITRSGSSATTYDPGGHTRRADFSGDNAPRDVDYVYAADGQLIARTVDGKTTYLFYFASGTRLAEQTRPSGATKTRYLNSPSGSVMAEQQYKEAPVGDPIDAPTWTWLLRDSDGNVATEVTADGTVASQRAYDPYGASDRGGSSKLEAHDRSDLGFQGDYTDGSTGNVAMGPRLYDPTTARFTTADFFAGADSDAALATDPLTGNRYLFAAANPVAFFDDGHGPMYCDGNSGGTNGESCGALMASLAAHNARHTSAQLATYAVVKTYSLLHGGGDVKMEYVIRGSSLRGGPGRADVIWFAPTGAYIWEIKPATPYGRTSGPTQLGRYVAALQANRRNLQVQRGFSLMPRLAPVFATRELLSVTSGAGVYQGVEFYSTIGRIPEPKPVEVPEMQPEPSNDWVPDINWGAVLAGVATAGAIIIKAGGCAASYGTACTI